MNNMVYRLTQNIYRTSYLAIPILLLSCGTGDNSTSSGTVNYRHPGSPTIKSPNGGEDWSRGTDYEIKWDVGDVNSNIKVELLDGNRLETTITTAHHNGGVLRWSVPFTIAAGSNYKIRLTGIDDATKTDESDDTFSLN